MKYKVLANDVFDGYKRGDIIEREPHAVVEHLEKEECQAVTEVVAKKVVEDTKKKADLECPDCGLKAKSALGLRSHMRKHK